MRRVPIEYAKEGHFLARPLFTDKGTTLVVEGTKLTERLIERIKQYGYSSIYIQDEYTREDIDNIIKPKVYTKMVDLSHKIEKVLISSNGKPLNMNEGRSLHQDMQEFTQVVNSIVNDLLNNKEILVHLNTISIHDDFTFNHSLNIMLLIIAISRECGLNMEQMNKISVGSMFHDIGKLLIPKGILLKPGKLTNEEFEIIREHPKKGFEFLRDYTDLTATARILAMEHHERYDGSGYPLHKKGTDIHLYGRMCAICDVYEALTADRPYRAGLPSSEAREMLMASGGTHFDMDLLKVFLSVVNPYPIDTMVSLSDGTEGHVIKVNGKNYTRPVIMIRCVGGRAIQGYEIDLQEVKNVVITNTIHNFSFDNAKRLKAIS